MRVCRALGISRSAVFRGISPGFLKLLNIQLSVRYLPSVGGKAWGIVGTESMNAIFFHDGIILGNKKANMFRLMTQQLKPVAWPFFINKHTVC